MEGNAKILQFPLSKCPEPALPLASWSSLVCDMDRRALDLAIVTDELSLRISRDRGRAITRTQVRKYLDCLTRTHTLLAQLEETVNRLEIDLF